MKNMKKLASLLLALTLLVALAVPAMATSITITSTIPEGSTANEVYSAYKVFDVVIGGENKTDSNAPHNYTIDSGSPFFAAVRDVTVGEPAAKVFELTQVLTSTTYNVKLLAANDEATAIAVAAALNAVENKGDPAATTNQHNDAGVYTLDLVDAGYYLITSTLGSKLVIDTVGAGQTLNINAKNQFPTLDKKIVDGENRVENITAAYGDTVTFEINVNVPATAVGAMTIHDVMKNDLTFNANSLQNATLVETTETAAEGYTHRDFQISAEQVALNLGKTISVTYTATLNSDAPIAEAIKNTAHLSYSNYNTQPSEVEVFTYEFDVVKTTSDGTKLDGALFELYDAATEGNVVALVKTGEGAYRVATPEEKAAEGFTSAVIETKDGVATISGLANGTYYLQENEAPEGYNKLKTRQEIVINNANVKANETASVETVDGRENVSVWGGVQVYNFTGAEMPSTGGIGTTIFYIVGGLLIAGAGILLITRKRMNGEEK